MNTNFMSEITEIVDILENRLQKLFVKYDSLEKENRELRQELHNSVQVSANLKKEIGMLQEKYNSIKMTNSLLGSEDYKRDTKLKINSLIREIDYCIAQLSD